MKLELDLSDRNALIEQQGELKRALAIVELALRQSAPASIASVEAEDLHSIALHTLPNQFSIAELMIAGHSRGAAKNLLTALTEAGRIRLVEPGRGRRASVYEKVA